jgi:hypothetical protein
MGKGSNVQKKQTAQARNLEKRGKSDEERKVAREKSVYVALCIQLLLVSWFFFVLD